MTNKGACIERMTLKHMAMGIISQCTEILGLPVVGMSPGFITLQVTSLPSAFSRRASSSDVMTLHWKE